MFYDLTRKGEYWKTINILDITHFSKQAIVMAGSNMIILFTEIDQTFSDLRMALIQNKLMSIVIK